MTEISQGELITDITPIAFNLGSVILTRGMDELCGGNHALLLPLLKRHDNCDWGNCAVWIITESDRSVTTILLPTEY
jgi:hypothetical protein